MSSDFYHGLLGVREDGPRVVLWNNRDRWSDFLELVVESDRPKPMDVTVSIALETERFRKPEYRSEASPIGMTNQIPAIFQGRGGVSVLAAISDSEGNALEPGFYKISGLVRPCAETFLGGTVLFSGSAGLIVRSATDARSEDLLEQQIQRHMLQGRTLRLRGMPESEKVFEEGLALVQEYLRRGGGDEEGIYNVTPRYQAAVLLAELERNKEAVSYLQRTYIDGVAAPACRWQPYHFFPNPDAKTVGPLPNQAKDVIYGHLQRLYMRTYGRTLQAIPPNIENGG